MSRLFLGQREMNFISDVTKELTRDVVGQVVYYYAISEAKNNAHDVYNENPDKAWDTPIELPALVSSPDAQVKTDIFGPEILSTIEVFLQYRDMVDVGLNVCVGDFVRYGDTVYEITSLTRMRNIYGHVEELDGFKLACVQSRRGQIDPPQVGPSDISDSDPGAVQREFSQTRGEKSVGGLPTGDKRVLRDEGVLEAPITGPSSVVDDERTGSDFYGEK